MRKRQNKQAKSQNLSGTGAIRIIAGKHRGRKLPVLMAEGLRPTTDRVKETVFNWLMPYINDANCLDCFAGSGSLGFEALSRGAKNVTLVELDKNNAKQLNANKILLKADNVTINNADTLQYLKQSPTGFDIIFIDPPFRKNLVNQTIECLQQGWLNDDALVYIETETEASQIATPRNWQLVKEKTAGQVSYKLYQIG